jgi:hypothetical protein
MDLEETGAASQQRIAAPPQSRRGTEMRGSYLRVLVVWMIVLAGLYALQVYFS